MLRKIEEAVTMPSTANMNIPSSTGDPASAIKAAESLNTGNISTSTSPVEEGFLFSKKKKEVKPNDADGTEEKKKNTPDLSGYNELEALTKNGYDNDEFNEREREERPKSMPKPPNATLKDAEDALFNRIRPSAITRRVMEAVDNSDTLIHAFEAVGPMYGIQKTNLVPIGKGNGGIRVENDTIFVPDAPAKNQTKPIIQAIGSVLDYISQRADDKLNAYQTDNIKMGRLNTKMANCDPSKGKCIGIYDDDEGGEIKAYDTGLVDMPNTQAARNKVEELRANNTIPTFDPGIEAKQAGDEYFNDEDDVTEGVSMEASSKTCCENKIEENNVAEKIQESAYHLNMISKYNNTTHLGYDMLRAHGFEFVKPIDSVVVEAADVSGDDSSSDNKKVKINSSDIQYLKFDNKGILDAVKYFNEARADQDNIKKGNIDLEKFINNPNYDKAIDALNKQFNCKINIRFLKNQNEGINDSTTAFTVRFKEYNKKLTISKSKGFQLGGLPIDIMIIGHYVETSAPNSELFGQYFVATILHEIFHNISAVMRENATETKMGLAMTMNLAACAKTAKEKRIIVTNYVDSLEERNGSKLFNRGVKRRLVKALTSLATVADNDKVQNEMRKSKTDKKNPDEYIESLIKLYKDSTKAANKRQNAFKKKSSFGMFVSAAMFVASIIAPVGFTGAAVLTSIGALSFMTSFGSLCFNNVALATLRTDYANDKKYEEYYADLFAGMYKLPVVFFVGDKKHMFTANNFKSEKLDELARIEKTFHETIRSDYPSNLERNRAAVKLARNLLTVEDLDEPMKKYCQWIVDNFSNLENTNIDKIYNKTTFDPKEADNLDKHLEDLINDNNVVLTESYVQWMDSDEMIF